MTDTSGYRTAVGSPITTSPLQLVKPGPGPVKQQRKPKLTLPKDDSWRVAYDGKDHRTRGFAGQTPAA